MTTDTISFDSKEEEMFYSWLKEAKDNGFVKEYSYHPKIYNLCEVAKVPSVSISKKGRVKHTNRHLLNSLNYTPDFDVVFSSKFVKVFMRKLDVFDYLGKHIQLCLFNDSPEFTVIIDTKGSFVGKNNNSGITFPVKQKILWATQHIYTQKVVPKKWFKKTWCPSEFAWKKKRKIPTRTVLGESCSLISELEYC